MAVTKELDDRMTLNIQSDKKKKLIRIAEDKRISYSKLLLGIVDEWLEKEENNGRTSEIS